MTESNLIYAIIDTTRFYIHALTQESTIKNWPDEYKEIRINDQYLVDLVKNRNPKFPLKYNKTHYPALMGAIDILALKDLAKKVPDGGIIVETGSAYGGSAYAMAEVISNDTTLYCIDEGWKTPDHTVAVYLKEITNQYLQLNNGVFNFTSSYDFAKNYLSRWPNVKLIQASSPYEMQYWETQIDLLFEDSSHANIQFRDNLEFWLKFIKPGGIISGHDYNDLRYPDIVTETKILAEKLRQPLNISYKSNIWWIQKPWQ